MPTQESRYSITEESTNEHAEAKGNTDDFGGHTNNVKDLTAKLTTKTKTVHDQETLVSSRDEKIKSLTDKRDELLGTIATLKAARSSERNQYNYLEKVRGQLMRGWYLCDKLEIRENSVWLITRGPVYRKGSHYDCGLPADKRTIPRNCFSIDEV